MMNSYDTIIIEHGLRISKVLQETETKKVELVEAEDGQKFVLKFCKTNCPLLHLEVQFLKLTSKSVYQNLELPEVIASGSNYFLMSYVEREYLTRDTILLQEWSPQDIKTLCGGIREIQDINLSTDAFTLKQKLMGFVYPVTKLALIIPKCMARSVISARYISKSVWLGLEYLLLRTGFSNVTTHYDLTTLNCAFTPGRKLSILDFELGYRGGDPLFDICYFVTIPPQPMLKWGFQNRALTSFIGPAPDNAQQKRLRFILLVCCLVRAIHFPNGSPEQQAYKESISLLLNRSAFGEWWQTLHDHKPRSDGEQ